MNFTSIENNLTLLELCLHIKSLTDDFYLVGGCVRNMLLNKTPKDFDIVCKLDLLRLKKCVYKLIKEKTSDC